MNGPTGQTKEAIDAFLVENYEGLKRMARGYVSKRRNTSGHTREVAEEVFSYVVNELYSGRESVAVVAAVGGLAMLKWCSAVMRNSVRKDSGFELQRRRTYPLDPATATCSWVRSSNDGEEGSDPSDFAGHASPVVGRDCEADGLHDLSEASSFQEAELILEGMHPDRIAEFLAVSPCVQAMPIHKRVLVGMYFVDGMSIRKIAAEKGIPQSSVFELVREAKRDLRECIGAKTNPLL